MIAFKKLLYLSLITPSFFSFSQDVLWQKTLGGKHAEFLYDAQPTADYGFILAGSSLSVKSGDKEMDNLGDLDYWVWKMNEKGDLEWQKSFGGNGTDQLTSLKLTHDGGFLLGGSSTSAKGLKDEASTKKEDCFGLEDFWIVKLNATGAEEWQKTFGGYAQDYVTQVIQTKDNGFLIAGNSASGTSGNKETSNYGALDFWILKIDAKGKLLWQKSFGGLYNDELKSAIETADGGFLLGGSSNSPASGTKLEDSKGSNDFWLVKIDENGQEEWQKVIGSKYDDQLAAVIQDFEKNYIVAGNTNSKDEGKNKDMLVIQLDEKGEKIWEETYDFSKKDYLNTIIASKDSTYIIGGNVQKNEKSGADHNSFVLFKINARGEKIWDNQLESQSNDILRKVIETRDGGYLLSGTRKSPSSRGVPAEGGRGVQNTKETKTANNSQSSDFYVVKLKDKNKAPEIKVNVEAFPNPAQTYTNLIINYDYKKGTATVYDLNGRLIQSKDLEGSRTIPMDISALPNGIFIIEIKTDVQKDGIKIMKN